MTVICGTLPLNHACRVQFDTRLTVHMYVSMTAEEAETCMLALVKNLYFLKRVDALTARG
jgi:hypothetical protein